MVEGHKVRVRRMTMPIRVLSVYDEGLQPMLEKLIKDSEANMLWLEFSDERYNWKLLEELPLPPQNIFVVCKTGKCVEEAHLLGFRVVLDVEGCDNVRYLPDTIRVKWKDEVVLVASCDSLIEEDVGTEARIERLLNGKR